MSVPNKSKQSEIDDFRASPPSGAVALLEFQLPTDKTEARCQLDFLQDNIKKMHSLAFNPSLIAMQAEICDHFEQRCLQRWPDL
jgi:hypothetical protein